MMTFTELKAAVIAELTARDPRDTYCSIRVEDTHYHTGREDQTWTVYTARQAEQFDGPTAEVAFQLFLDDLRSKDHSPTFTDNIDAGSLAPSHR